MPPAMLQKEEPLDNPSLEEISTRTSRRRARGLPIAANENSNVVSATPFQNSRIPFTDKKPRVSANDDEQKRKDIENNVYLAKKPANDNTYQNPAVSNEVNEAVNNPKHIGQVNKGEAADYQKSSQPNSIKSYDPREMYGRNSALLNTATNDNQIQGQIRGNSEKAKLKKKIQAIQAVFHKHKIDLSLQEAKHLLKQSLKSRFPMMLFFLALLKDIGDLFIGAVTIGSLGVGIVTTSSVVGAGPGIGFVGLSAGMWIAGTIYSAFSMWLRRFVSKLYITSLFGNVKVVQKIMRSQRVGDIATGLGDMFFPFNILPLPLINFWRKFSKVSKILRECRNIARS